MVKPVPEGLSIRPCVWPVGSRAYPRSGVGFFVRTKFEVLGQDSQFGTGCRRSCPKTVLAHSPAAFISSRSAAISFVVNGRYVTGCFLCSAVLRFGEWGRFRIRNLKYVKECEPQQRQGFAQAPHLWKPHFRDSRNSAVSAVQYESGFRESNMPYQHCRV